MFHSVGNQHSEWNRKYLSISVTHFEKFCQYILKEKYQTLSLVEWYNLSGTIGKEKRKYIVLTFDDGYLDNWVFVYPLLKKYGLKGTIFINPEFMDPCDYIRPNLDDVREGRVTLESLQTLGFLSWQELIKMDSEEVLQAQSHSMSHNFYFKSERIIDFYFSQSDYDWISWFLNSSMKPFSLIKGASTLIPHGFPVFEFGRALSLRRFIPENSFIELLTQESKNLREDNKEKLIKIANNYLEKHGTYGRYETDEEMYSRYHYDIFESKRILEEKLNHKVDFLCWPGGGYNDLAISISKLAGYKASTISSNDKNYYPVDSYCYKRINRFGLGSFIYSKGGRRLSKLPNHLILVYKAKTGHFLSRIVLKLEKTLF